MTFAGREFSERHLIMIGALLVLLILNVLRWLPDSANGDNSWSGKPANGAAEELLAYLNYVKPGKKELEIHRDLFSPVISVSKSIRPAIVKKTIIKEEPKQASASKLDGYKLEGIIDGGGRIQAFVSRQDEIFMVYKGDKLTGTVVVDAIRHNGIFIKDTDSGENRWIGLDVE